MFVTKPSYLSITSKETVQNSKSKPKKFSFLCTIKSSSAFTPMWAPPVSEIAKQDACHSLSLTFNGDFACHSYTRLSNTTVWGGCCMIAYSYTQRHSYQIRNKWLFCGKLAEENTMDQLFTEETYGLQIFKSSFLSANGNPVIQKLSLTQ
jgi:hypothetical protein